MLPRFWPSPVSSTIQYFQSDPAKRVQKHGTNRGSERCVGYGPLPPLLEGSLAGLSLEQQEPAQATVYDFLADLTLSPEPLRRQRRFCAAWSCVTELLLLQESSEVRRKERADDFLEHCFPPSEWRSRISQQVSWPRAMRARQMHPRAWRVAPKRSRAEVLCCAHTLPSAAPLQVFVWAFAPEAATALLSHSRIAKRSRQDVSRHGPTLPRQQSGASVSSSASSSAHLPEEQQTSDFSWLGSP